MKKRSIMALVASGLLAAMLPAVASAQEGSTANATTIVVLAPDYVWNGRLAASGPAIDYVWNGRLAASGPAIDYVWNGRLAAGRSLELVAFAN